MTIARRLAVGYAWISLACLMLVAWLGYHEFVEEPAEYARMGLVNLHKDTAAELSTVLFLSLIPVLLWVGWWWMRRVLAPLNDLSRAVEQLQTHNLRQPLPRTMNGDEVDKLTAVFNSMTARLDDSFRQVQEFTLHASHELKTPLTVMRAQLETALRENQPIDPALGRYVDSQLDEVKRLTRIVDSLTLLTKADAGVVELERKPVPLAELVREAFEDAQILAQPRGIRVQLNDCGECTVEGDRHRLRQLLLILTDNAVKYNVAEGMIGFSLRRADDHAQIQIVNSSAGPALPSSDHLFDRFVRGDNAREGVEGSGLGLSIARWIAQAHRGSIELLQETAGRTKAVVRIPLRLTDSDPTSAPLV